jgi:hypothetical protein
MQTAEDVFPTEKNAERDVSKQETLTYPTANEALAKVTFQRFYL